MQGYGLLCGLCNMLYVILNSRKCSSRNYKPSESDLEDDDEQFSDDEDPSKWFEDDQDDGRKGQDIVEPDEDFSEIIRVDASRVQYSTFYDPRDDGD